MSTLILALESAWVKTQNHSQCPHPSIGPNSNKTVLRTQLIFPFKCRESSSVCRLSVMGPVPKRWLRTLLAYSIDMKPISQALFMVPCIFSWASKTFLGKSDPRLHPALPSGSLCSLATIGQEPESSKSPLQMASQRQAQDARGWRTL